MIDYISQLNAFNERCQIKGYSPMVRVVYYTLLDMNNRLFWETSFTTTIRIIADRSGANKNVVNNALQILKEEGLIKYTPSKVRGVGSIFSICPLCGTQTGTQTGTENSLCTDTGTQTGTQTGTLKRHIQKTYKEGKPQKKSYAENVTMTKDEYEKLKERFNGNELAVKRCIEILDNYKGSKGATYKSDYRAILSWVVGKYEKEYGNIPVKKPISEAEQAEIERQRAEEEAYYEAQAKAEYEREYGGIKNESA